MKKYKNTILKGDGNLIAKQINFELKRMLQREKRDNSAFLQRTKDSYFSATSLLKKWNKNNSIRKKE